MEQTLSHNFLSRQYGHLYWISTGSKTVKKKVHLNFSWYFMCLTCEYWFSFSSSWRILFFPSVTCKSKVIKTTWHIKYFIFFMLFVNFVVFLKIKFSVMKPYRSTPETLECTQKTVNCILSQDFKLRFHQLWRKQYMFLNCLGEKKVF